MLITNKKRKSLFSAQSGASLIIALVFMTGLFLILTGALRFQRTTAENIAQSSTASKEKWQARARTGRGAGWVISKMPSVYRAQVQAALGQCDNKALPAFNDLGDTSSACIRSLLGPIEPWLQSQRGAAIAYAANNENQGTGGSRSSNVKIDLSEAYRFDQIGGTNGLEKIYVINYLVDSKYNDYGSDSQQGTVVLHPNEGNCNSEVRITVNPTSIIIGSAVNITATYWRATELRLYRNNILIQTQPVIDKTTQQSFLWTDIPPSAGQTDYYVTASEPGQCSASSEIQSVTVALPPVGCTTSLDSFTISSTNVYDGDPVTVSWITSNATTVTLDNNPVGGSGSQTFVINGARTFTLRSTGPPPCTPDTRTVNVTSQPRPVSCAFGAPSVNLDLVASSVLTNGAFVANWTASSLVTGTGYGSSIVLTGPNGYSQTLSGNSGSVQLNAPGSSGNYTYTITATNVCNLASPPETLQSSNVKILTVSNSPCAAAIINSFNATPSTYNVGSVSNITLNWSTSGDVSNIVIVNLGTGATVYNGSLSSGSVSIIAPTSSTTLQMIATACGNNVTSTVPITVGTTSTSSDFRPYFKFNSSEKIIIFGVGSGPGSDYTIALNVDYKVDAINKKYSIDVTVASNYALLPTDTDMVIKIIKSDSLSGVNCSTDLRKARPVAYGLPENNNGNYLCYVKPTQTQSVNYLLGLIGSYCEPNLPFFPCPNPSSAPQALELVTCNGTIAECRALGYIERYGTPFGGFSCSNCPPDWFKDVTNTLTCASTLGSVIPENSIQPSDVENAVFTQRSTADASGFSNIKTYTGDYTSNEPPVFMLWNNVPINKYMKTGGFLSSKMEGIFINNPYNYIDPLSAQVYNYFYTIKY